MILKDISFDIPEENLLFDDVLLHLADKVNEQEYLRFWQSSVYFVVMGRISREEEDVNFDAIKADGVPLLRRSSGGGTVIQGKGCLNFALVLDKRKNRELDDLKKSYTIILDQICAALKQCGIKAKVMPISDIALMNDQKISGNAQKRGRNFILHHGTILCDFDLSVIEKYLFMPKDMPDYRNGRTHLAFVGNIGVGVDQVKEAIRSVFSIKEEESDLTDQENNLLKKFIKSHREKICLNY